MEKVKDIIITKSFGQFLNKGYEATSLKDLEQVTGLTKGAFYHYFKNKEQILKAGLEKYDIVIQSIDKKKLSVYCSLKEYIENVIEIKQLHASQLKETFGFFIIEEFYFQLILEVENIFPEYRKKVDNLLKKRLLEWEEVILRAKQTGEINVELDTTILSRNLMAVSMSMVNIDFLSSDLKYAFSDIRLQFEQYYSLVKNNG